MNYVQIEKTGNFNVQPITLSTEKTSELENSLLLVFTGIFRNSSDLAEMQIKNIPKSTSRLEEMGEIVLEARQAFTSVDFIKCLGNLLNETWHLKKHLNSSVSNSLIDDIYTSAINAGAYGGKLLGAGAGGFMVFVMPEEAKSNVEKVLASFVQVPIRLDQKGAIIQRSDFK